MKVIKSKIEEVLIIEPVKYDDERGFFFESYNKKKFDEILGREVVFVQDNCSLSYKGVLRGLHYQLPPYAQAKLVQCIEGEIFDVAVDIRKGSATYGQWVGEIISAENMKQIWIPEGFAHGFFTLSDTAKILYKTTNHYVASHEATICWNDKDINIDWPLAKKIIMSQKDIHGTALNSAKIFD